MSDTIDKKIDNLANAVAVGFKELRSEMQSGFKELREEIRAVDQKVTIVDQKVDVLRSEIMAMHYDYKKLIARIEKLELTNYGSIQE